MSRRKLWLPLIFPCLVLIGCSDPHAGRQAISGTVTLKDQPIKNGIVMFEPLDGQDTSGNATITDGKYAMAREAGLKAGKYRVRVTAGDGKTAVNLNPDEPPGPGGPGGTNIVSKDLVPASWNTQSKQEVTVKGDGPNTFNFDIK